jgi:hypothetical protein
MMSGGVALEHEMMPVVRAEPVPEEAKSSNESVGDEIAIIEEA